MKTSTVMISAGAEPEFYGSVQEVPEPLRTHLIEVTSGSNSGTIVIADQAGKEQITQVMARRDNARGSGQKNAAKTDAGEPGQLPEVAAAESAQPSGLAWTRLHWMAWAGAAAVLLAGGAIAAVFLSH